MPLRAQGAGAAAAGLSKYAFQSHYCDDAGRMNQVALSDTFTPLACPLSAAGGTSAAAAGLERVS